jgi:phage recombination protein Bet
VAETGITKAQAAKLKKDIIEREGGICNSNAEQLLAVDKMVTEPDTPITVVEVMEQKHPAVVEHIAPTYTEEDLALIKAKFAPNATESEFKLLMYMSKKFGLDPLLKEIWLVKFGDSPAQIYAGRDGYLKVAHRSGQFDGMKTTIFWSEDGKKVTKATCMVWRKDTSHPFESEVYFSEYTTGKNLWNTKPSVMLGKVAESVALRKAFSVAGMYSPEEMGDSPN